MRSELETRIWLVEQGKSRIFQDWKDHAGITEEAFIEGLEWLDGDGGNAYGLMTRELGCDPRRGLVKLKRLYNRSDFAGFYEAESGKPWPRGVKPSINKRDRI